jgi:redox-sensitive bicupin YhaK (pirin superfamily)
VFHSEKNRNPDEAVKFLQIWVFPKVQDIKPRYDQKAFTPESRVNKLQEVVSPIKGSEGLWINQDAWFHLGNFQSGFTISYDLKQKGNGVYVFVLEGKLSVNDQQLGTRDGLGIWDTDSIALKADTDAQVLLMEVPMLTETD